MKKYVVTLIALGALALTGCEQGVDNSNAKSGLVTSEGVKVESLLPEDTFMVMKLGTDDIEQQAHMDKLASYFPQDAWASLMKELASDFNDDFGTLGVTFEGDLLPAIGDNAQLMAGFFGEISEDEEPNILMVASFAQPKTFAGWMEDATSEGHGQKQTYKEFNIYNGPGEESYIVHYKDVLVMGSTVQLVKEAIDRAENGSASLLSSASYQKGLENMPNALGFFYIDPSFSVDVLKADSKAVENLDTEYLEDLIEAIDGEFFAFSAEPNGIRIAGSVYGDPAKWKELEEIANFDIDPSYLYKQLPGKGVMLYMESSGFQKSANAMFQMYKNLEGFDDAMDSMKSALAAQGIDFDQDVLSFMDKGYAMGVYDHDSIFPSFGIFIDASSNRAGAEKAMAQLYASIDEEFENIPPGLETVVTHEESTTKGGKNYAVKVNVENLPEEELSNAPVEIQSAKIEFHYGVNIDDLAYLAFYPGFDNFDYTTMDNDDDFKDSFDQISGFDRGVSYFDIETTMTYVDRLVDFGQRMDGDSIDDLYEYQMVRTYIGPIKNIIMGASETNEGEVKVQGFVNIGPSTFEMTVPVMEENVLSKADCRAQCEIQAVGRDVVDQCIAEC